MPKLKYFEVPKEIMDVSSEWDNYIELRELYTKVPFGFKKAVKCGKLAKEKASEFWDKLHELYPELKDKKAAFDGNRIYITIED